MMDFNKRSEQHLSLNVHHAVLWAIKAWHFTELWKHASYQQCCNLEQTSTQQESPRGTRYAPKLWRVSRAKKRCVTISHVFSLEDRIVDAAEHPQAKFATQFWSDNKEDISNAAKAFASSENVKDIQDKVKNFTESSKFLMDVLSEVEKLHPFIG